MASSEEHAAAANPRTDLTELARLAHEHPDLRPVVASNPSAYEGLLEWLGAIGDPAVNAALAARSAAPGVAASGWHEPARDLPLRWGTYEIRYGIGLGLLLVAQITPFAWSLGLPGLILMAVVIAAGVAVMPSTIGRRIGAGAIGLVTPFLAFGFLFGGVTGLGGLVLPLLVWLLLRLRNGLSYLLLIAAALLGVGLSFLAGGGLYGYYNDMGSYLLVSLASTALVAGLAWAARAIHKVRAPAIARNKARVAAYQAQYAAAYQQPMYAQPGYPQPGYPVAYPGGPVVARPGAPTNTTAVLALVFGIGGGLLGIILGHTARAQIRRTGEAGWGLATAGLVFGYIGLGVGVVLGIIYVVILTR